jgi:hypothetical protein
MKSKYLRFNGWVITLIIGVIVVIFQLIMPDEVPQLLNRIFTDKYITSFPPLLFLHDFVFIVWVFVGYVSIATGIIGIVASGSSSKPK